MGRRCCDELGHVCAWFSELYDGLWTAGYAKLSVEVRISAHLSTAPTSLTNGPPFIEIQGEYILKVLIDQREQNIRTIESTSDAEQAWREHVLSLVEKTLLVETNSWYMGAK